jgi:predicted ArsR family transcriptional regulator
LAQNGELRNTIVVKKSEDKTRDLVARTILENGPQSALDLAARLNLTPAGIRRHLDRLIESGLLEAREPHRASTASRGRGRPSKVFVITDLGREKFEHSYDDLALSALRFMENLSERDLVSEFAASRANDIERRVAHAIKGASSQSKKIAALTEFLATEGYAAESKGSAAGTQLCQHHCPIAHVASEFEQLCEAETEAFSRVLGTHVQRLATIALGDGVCTTFIPNVSATAISATSISTASTTQTKKGAHA